MIRLVLRVRHKKKEVRRYHFDYDETEGNSMTLEIGEYLYLLDINGRLLEQTKIKK